MIKMLKKIRRILLRNKWKNIGKEKENLLTTIRDYINSFLYGIQWRLERIKEIILFIPVIYKVVRWDYSSIFIILQHWLERMEECHNNVSFHRDAPRHANRIHTCVLLLKRITADEYDNIIYQEREADGWKLTYDKKKYDRLYKHTNQLRNQDLDMLFKYIKKYHVGWWV